MKKTVIKGMIFGMTSILTMFITGFFVVKALTVLNNVEKGDTLTASTINTIISHLVPSGAIIPFNQETCPDGWIPADGASGTVDLRGEFIRGWDDGRGVDEGRILGNRQDHALQDHRHDFQNRLGGRFGSSDAISTSDTNYSYSNNTSYIKKDSNINISDETRPRNVALLYCIKQ